VRCDNRVSLFLIGNFSEITYQAKNVPLGMRTSANM